MDRIRGHGSSFDVAGYESVRLCVTTARFHSAQTLWASEYREAIGSAVPCWCLCNGCRHREILPRDAPGVLWEGGFADDGSIAAKTKSEINGNEATLRCFSLAA
jgi:hypothetical protein